MSSIKSPSIGSPRRRSESALAVCSCLADPDAGDNLPDCLLSNSADIAVFNYQNRVHDGGRYVPEINVAPSRDESSCSFPRFANSYFALDSPLPGSAGEDLFIGMIGCAWSQQLHSVPSNS